MDERAERFIKRLSVLQTERSTFNNQWDDITKVVRPAAASFFSLSDTPGEKRGQELYDSTGVHANELLASGFYSLLTSPTTQWFDIATEDPRLNQNRDVKIWLSEVSKVMYFEIQRPQTGFATALHELYLDYGSYGNGILFVTERPDMSSLLFTALPLQECYFIEGDHGHVIAMYRHYNRTVQQLVDRFGIEKVSKKTQDLYQREKLDDKLECLHVIEPSKDGRLAYSSIYIEIGEKHILSDKGFNEMPFMATRFYKTSYEVYGRGPGSTSLSDLKMLQEISKTTIRGAQKMVDPPLMVPDTGYLSAIRTMPGGVNYFRPGLSSEDRISPLLTNGQPNLGEDLAQGIRARIREMFYVDQLQLNTGPQMTATEVLQRTEEKMRLMGPIVGRAMTELLGPCLKRVFGLLLRDGKLPPPPEVLGGVPAKLKIVYTSPIAKSQSQTEANSLLRVTQLITPFASVDPTVMDVFNNEAIVRGVCDMYAINPSFLRTPEEIQQMQQQRQQMQEMQAQVQMFKDGGAGVASMAQGLSKLGGPPQ